MIKTLFQLILFVLIVLSCSTNEDSKSRLLESNIYKIDLSKEGLSASKKPILSSLAEKIEYIPLETTEKSLVKGNYQVYASSDYIYTIGFRQILQFDRRDGTFIKELGRFGQGPNEYTETLPYTHSGDIDRPLVLTSNYVKMIDAESNQLKTIAKRIVSSQSFASLDSGFFVSFLPNFACNENDRLVLYNKEGVEIKRYPNHLRCQLKDKNSISFDLSEGKFYYHNTNLFFKEVFNDTIFKVGKERLEKHAFFHLESLGIPYSEKENLNERITWDKIIVTNAFESDDYIFFTYVLKNATFSGVFDKNKHSIFIPDKRADQNGIQDDINGFLDFKPLTIGEENEVVSYFNPEDVLNWFEKRKDNAQVPEILRVLKKLKYDDNPIIAIVKLKSD
ncbi:MAG: 6-bladed beta-propeller [Cytophagia bacterium]|nr:6-bladed beta-propeller [Cytophagia bacterium]